MEEKLFPVEEFQVINIKGQTTRESRHFATTSASADRVPGYPSAQERVFT